MSQYATERPAAYAFGRAVEFCDQRSVRAIVRAADYRWSSIIPGLVGSPALREPRGIPRGVIRLASARRAVQIVRAGGGADPTPYAVGPLIAERTR